MTIQIINVGTSADDGTGDTLRNAFIKINNNFDELGNKQWVNPNTNSTWSIVEKTDGIIVTPDSRNVTSLNTNIILQVTNSNSFYVPRNANNSLIQDFWDGELEDTYDYIRFVINSTTYNGDVITYDETGWIITLTENITANANTPVTFNYVDFAVPVKFFDAENYENSENFLGAILEYFTLVENYGTSTGSVWMTNRSGDTSNSTVNFTSTWSGVNQPNIITFASDPNANSNTSLFLVIDTPNPEKTSIFWNAKLFYGANVF